MKTFFMLILLFFQQSYGQDNYDGAGCEALSIYHFVKDSVSDYTFISASDASGASLQNYIDQSLGCVSDFNGDDIKDYALFLRDKNNKVCLFYFSLIKDNVMYYPIDCFGTWDNEVKELRVAVEPKGKWEAISQTIKVPYDGLIVDDLRESKSKAYYWSNGKFVRFRYD